MRSRITMKPRSIAVSSTRDAAPRLGHATRVSFPLSRKLSRSSSARPDQSRLRHRDAVLGIHMPARACVVSSFTKFDGRDFAPSPRRADPADGRAGRPASTDRAWYLKEPDAESAPSMRRRRCERDDGREQFAPPTTWCSICSATTGRRGRRADGAVLWPVTEDGGADSSTAALANLTQRPRGRHRDPLPGRRRSMLHRADLQLLHPAEEEIGRCGADVSVNAITGRSGPWAARRVVARTRRPYGRELKSSSRSAAESL